MNPVIIVLIYITYEGHSDTFFTTGIKGWATKKSLSWGDYDESKPPHPLFQNLNKQKKVDEYTYGDALPL